MHERHVAVVRERLQEYADRRVFTGFGELERRGGVVAFAFVWLHHRRFVLEFNANTGKLRLRGCLPRLEPKSRMTKGVRTFLEGRSERSLPAHRRVDPGRAELRLAIAKGDGTLEMTVHRNQYKYAVGKLINVVHELFLYINVHFPEYLHEHFGLPEE